MAKCPKCEHKLGIFHLSPYCPKCGTHIMFANFEPQFEIDRRKSEMSLGNFRVNVDKFISAYASGMPQKVKIGTSILPLIGLIIPFGSISIESAIHSGKLNFNALDMAYNAFMGGGFARIGELNGTMPFGDITAAVQGLMTAFGITAIFAALILVAELICFIGNKKSCGIIAGSSILGILGTIFSLIKAIGLKNVASSLSSIIDVKITPIFVLPIIFFAIAGFAAFWNLKYPPVRKSSEEDRLRADYFKKYKKGKIDIMDIPAPIAETETDRKERERLVKEAYHMNTEDQEEEVDG